MISLVFVLLLSGAFGLAPILVPQNAEIINGQYLVVFKDEITPKQRETFIDHLASSFGASDELLANYSIGSFSGFGARLSDELVAFVQHSKLVKYVEPDQVMRALQGACVSQKGAVWGLDRIDNRAYEGTGIFNYGSNAGRGVTVYIIDTGLLVSHVEFNTKRATWGANFVDSTNTDCNGHGTHVGGTVAGVTYGVAKQASLVAVKVLNCGGSGATTGVISGIQYVTAQRKTTSAPSVANMSLGGGTSQALDDAVVASIQAGVTYAVAAGNNNQDACGYSPARVSPAITVGATTIEQEEDVQKDSRSSFSNFGNCLDVFAPGELIESAWIDATDGSAEPNTNHRVISGTSMASPHVAGVAALYLGTTPDAQPGDVFNYIYSQTTKNAVDLSCSPGRVACPGTPNTLLFAQC